MDAVEAESEKMVEKCEHKAARGDINVRLVCIPLSGARACVGRSCVRSPIEKGAEEQKCGIGWEVYGTTPSLGMIFCGG